MESIGDKIRKVREEKGYSLDQVARDTHITKRFLEALEVENFSSMPGESYVIGFLRSYTEYLGMNPEEIVNLYKNLKLQEQPAPMNELLERTSIPRTTLIGIVCIAIVAIVGIIFLVTSNSTNANQSIATQTLAPKPDKDNKTFQNDVLERTFSSGETLKYPVNGAELDLLVTIKDQQVLLGVNGNSITLPPQKESMLDLDQDGKMDLRITVRDIDTKSNPAKVVLRFDRVVQSPQALASVSAQPSLAPTANGLVPIGMTNQPGRIKPAISFPEYTDLQNISIIVRFEGSCVFRYETNDGKHEGRLMGAGDSVAISATSNIRLWIANGGKAYIKVGGKEIKAGNDGELITYSLDWATNGTSRQLQMAPMY